MTIHIFGGGTVQHVRNHLALCAPAYGHTARVLAEQLQGKAELHLTRMADQKSVMETNEDVLLRLKVLLDNPETRAIVFNVAMCDYQGQIGDVISGKYAQRLHSREGAQSMVLTPTTKLLEHIKWRRPDVYLVGFKTTAGANEAEQHLAADRQIRDTGADLVVANDTLTRQNLLVTAHGAICWPRERVLQLVVEKLLEATC